MEIFDERKHVKVQQAYLVRSVESTSDDLARINSFAQDQPNFVMNSAESLVSHEFEKLTGDLVHEFNNLLLVISCASEHLMTQLSVEDPNRRAAISIRDAGLRAAELTSQLESFGRKQKPKRIVFDQDECVASTSRPSLLDNSYIISGIETILLVENEADIRQLMRFALESHGYQVLEAQHGPEAIATALRHSGAIHLLLADVALPEMSGCAVADALQLDYPGLPALFVSGLSSDQVNLKGQTNVAYSFIQKPFKMVDLLREVRILLDSFDSTYEESVTGSH